MPTTISAPPPLRVFHDKAVGFDFENDSGARIETGTKIKANDMIGITHGPVEIGSSGTAYFLTGTHNVYRIDLPTPVAAAVEMGTIFTDADGDILGVYVSDSLKNGAFANVNTNPFAANVGDTAIFICGLPGIIGSTTTAPTVTPETYAVPTYNGSGTVPSPLPATSGADRILNSFVRETTAGVAFDIDAHLATLDTSAIGPNYTLHYLNVGTGTMTTTDPAGTVRTFNAGETAAKMWDGTDWVLV